MNISLIIATEVLVMTLIMAIGAVCYRKNIISQLGIDQLSSLMINIINPAIIVNSYLIEYDPNKVSGLFFVCGISFILHMIYISIGRFVLFKQKNSKNTIDILSTTFANSGFLGFPLIMATLGSESTLYSTGYFISFTVLSWTYGKSSIESCSDNKSDFNIKKIILNPGIIGIFIGLSIYLLRIPIPMVLKDTIAAIASCTTAVSMLIIGAILGKMNISDILHSKRGFYISFVKNILYPVITILLFKVTGLMNISEHINSLLLVLVICCSCPLSVIISIFSQQNHVHPEYTAANLSLSTALSVVTIPSMVMLFQFVISL